MSTFTRTLLTISTGCLFFLSTGSAWAQQSCQADGDCPAGQSCIMTPCTAPACDPDDDPNCQPMPCPSEGTCEDDLFGGCSSDADCVAGFVCQEAGATDCASAPPCLPGETCPEPLPCEPERFFSCVPGPCSQDADCEEGLVCVTFDETICQSSSGAACGPGEDCTDPEPSSPSCEERSVSFCAPPYIAPCTKDSDCGEGFLCKPEQICSCSGGGATPTDPAEPDAGVPESECSCEPTGQNYCEAEQLPCATTAECPDGWSCESSVNVAVPCTFDPQTGLSECLPPVASETYCVPPSWGVWGTEGGSYSEAVDRVQDGAPKAPLTVQDSGGCAISAETDGGASGAMLLLLGLVLALRRRTRRR